MIVVSMFDGISCGQIALDQLGIPIEKYFACEIKQTAIKVTQNNYPDTIQMGDVRNICWESIGQCDLLLGGSPCQDFSSANNERLGLKGSKSSLFWEFMKAKQILKPKYFLFEKGMVFVCSECIHNSDISAINNKCLVEVEVKISKSDFRREFETATLKNGTYWKEKKHKFYANPEEAYSSYVIPNKFYFCVPKELEVWASEYMQTKNKKYGLLVYDEELTKTSKIRLVKGARNLQPNPPDSYCWRQIGQRVTNEMITLKEKYNKDKQELEALKKGVLVAEGIE